MKQKLIDMLGIKNYPDDPTQTRQQIMSFRPSIGKWYKRKCDFSGETIVTNYPTNARFPVYKKKYFDSDERTPAEQDIDREKPFFIQLQELQEKVPHPHQLGTGTENCDYCDDIWYSKNCFLSIGTADAEHLYYTYRNASCSYCYDIVYCLYCENSLGLTFCTHCHSLIHAVNCRNCSDSTFLYDCQQCSQCFMCRNLRDKKYCIRNQQYTPEEYKKIINEIDTGSRKILDGLQQEFQQHTQQDAYHRATLMENCENCQGNFLQNCNNCDNTFLREESENCCDVARGLRDKFCCLSTGMLNCEACYHICQSTGLYRCANILFSTDCKYSDYLDYCQNCEYCFACIGLKNKKYCIFNKQYTETEYNTRKEKLVQKMEYEGIYQDFFPSAMTYTGYNTTLARLFFPLNKEQALQKGLYREDGEDIAIIGDTYVLPDHIKDIANDTTQRVVICERTKTPFNITEQYITFHQKHNLALPRITHIERLKDGYLFLSNLQPQQAVSAISGNPLIHYYPLVLGFKKIVTEEEYAKIVYG